MRHIVLFFIITFFTLQNLSAQVKGIVVDSATNKAIESAVVGLVIKSNLTDTSYMLTNPKGEFSFETVPSSNFSVIITNVGYQPIAKLIRINTTEKAINLGNISLANMSKVMDEIVIHTSPITVKEDTIEYRADAFKVKENAYVEDLLKKLPGVEVDKDGNIKAQGKAVTKVKVNGKDFFGGDPKTATRELPANIVDKVQIVDDYGDQATISGIKEGDPQKVMNIQLKKDKNFGYFGRVTAGVGNEGRHQATINGNYFKDKQQISVFGSSNNTSQSLFNSGGGGGSNTKSGQDLLSSLGGSGDLQLNTGGGGSSDGITTSNSLGFNYRDDWSKKLTVYGSYSYSHRDNSGYRISSQQNIFSTGTIINNQNNNFENIGVSHRLFLNIEYNIDSFNYLKLSPTLTFGNNNGNNKTVFDYFSSDTKTSDGFYNTLTNSKTPNVTGSILYNHKFRKRGRNFSMTINGGNSENRSDQDSKNNTVKYIAPISNTNLFLFNTQQNNNHNYSVRLTYSEPLSKVRFLDLAFSHNLNYAKNDKIVYNVDPITTIKIINMGLSNAYENNYYNTRMNASIRTTKKRYNYSLGISVQPVDLRGLSISKDSAYRPIKHVNIFPVARFSYNFSRSQSLSFNYRGDAQQPSFTQLQDVMDSSNRQYQSRGNPNLKPSINHSLNVFYNNFNFTSGRVIFSSLSYSTIQNQIVSSTVKIDTFGSQLTTPQNVNGYYNVSGFYNLSKPFNNRKIVLSLSGNLNFNHNINFVDNIKSIGKNWVVNQGFNFELNQKEWLEFTLGANYSLNSIVYDNAEKNSTLQNDQYSSWTINTNASIDIPKNWVLKYDLQYEINQGLTGLVGQNLVVLNASLEKQIFKKKNGIIRLQGFDLFNQNSNITRSVNSNTITDSRSTRLNRYFMLSFTYRLQKFAGKQGPTKLPTKVIKL
jgi:hypothetical protein